MSDHPFGFGFGSGNSGSGDDGPGSNGPGSNGPGIGGPGQNPFDMNSIGAALQQLGAFLQSAGTSGETGPVNWQMVRDIARQQLASADVGGDPVVAEAQARAVSEAVHLADLWLDEATVLPATSTAPLAWSRSEWLEQTLPMWQRYVEPIAVHMQQVVGGAMPNASELGGLDSEALNAALPEQFRAMFPGGVPAEMMSMLQPMLGMAQQLGSAAFSMQLGQALAALAKEVVGAGDIGIPLLPSATCALLPRNVEELGQGIGVDANDVRLYLALRESAHQRLFAHVPWLRARMIGAIEEYARGIRVDPDRLQEVMGDVDLSNPQALSELMSSGLLQPQDTDEQRAAIARLETLLALVEGWVDDVVSVAAGARLPTAQALQETMRRRRAAGGPAERTFSSLVGMDLRPRALREAATLFAAVRASGGTQARDALWAHPDMLPAADDLTDPLGFIERSSGPLDLGSPDEG
ncbi:MAG: hydrolase [Actinobacteria bacterium]|jgi:putative hydrolase|nr:hydrolase [Actinomycetota bacterium]